MKIARLLRYTALLPLTMTLCAHADSSMQDVIKHLSPNAQAIMQRLGELNHLTSGKWRFHAGDIPHGESPGLNDNNWQLVGKDTEAPTAAAWYRQWIEVPKDLYGYDLTGARIWFHFAASTHGPLEQIVYVNGRRIASGDHLEPVLLFDQAKPGDKVLVAVKLPITMDAKTFDDAQLSIEFPQSRESPEEVREQLLSAAALAPSLSKDPTTDQATLETAIQLIDLKALEKGDQAKFDLSLKQALAMLQPYDRCCKNPLCISQAIPT